MRSPIKKTIPEIPYDVRATDKHQVIFNAAKDSLSPNIVLVAKSYLDAGAAFDWHKHDEFDEFFIVVAGDGVVSFKTGEALPYKEGDVVNCPVGLEHRIENTGKETGIFYFFRIKS